MKQTGKPPNSSPATNGLTEKSTSGSTNTRRRLMPEAVMPSVPMPALEIAWSLFDTYGRRLALIAGILRSEGFHFEHEVVDVIYRDYEEIKGEM